MILATKQHTHIHKPMVILQKRRENGAWKILLMVMIIVIGKEQPREQFHSIHM